MVGTNDLNPPGTVIPRFAHGSAHRRATGLLAVRGMGGNRFIERAVTDEIMYDLMQLSGQQYVDLYAADLKNTGNTPRDIPSRRRAPIRRQPEPLSRPRRVPVRVGRAGNHTTMRKATPHRM